MTDEELKHFVDTVAAATMANKAIFTLYMAGLPISRENAAKAYGKWISPSTPHFERLVLAIDRHIGEMMRSAEELSPPARGNA